MGLLEGARRGRHLITHEPRAQGSPARIARLTFRIVIRPRRHADVNEMIPWLAHELQDAVEIAAAGAASVSEVRRLYERTDCPAHAGRHETQAAIEAGERARADRIRPRTPR